MSTLTATAQPAPGSSLKRLVARHPLVSYFVLAFAGAWIFQIPLLLAQNGFGFLPWTLPTDLFTIPAVIVGPFLAALVVAAVADGRAGLQQLLRAYGRWRVRIHWYVLALLFYPGLLFLLTVLVLHRSPLDLFRQLAPLLVTVFLPGMLEILVVAQLWEEVGWRGFALPRLQRRFGPLLGTVILGTLWMCWHLPAFFYAGGATEGARMAFTLPGFIQFFIGELINSVLLSLMFTWMYNTTRGSLPLIILFHTVIDATNRPFFRLMPEQTFVTRVAPLGTAVFIVLVVVIVVWTRGRLGYKAGAEA